MNYSSFATLKKSQFSETKDLEVTQKNVHCTLQCYKIIHPELRLIKRGGDLGNGTVFVVGGWIVIA